MWLTIREPAMLELTLLGTVFVLTGVLLWLVVDSDDDDWEGKRSNQLVIIGRELDHDTIKQQLQACVAPDARKGFS